MENIHIKSSRIMILEHVCVVIDYEIQGFQCKLCLVLTTLNAAVDSYTKLYMCITRKSSSDNVHVLCDIDPNLLQFNVVLL